MITNEVLNYARSIWPKGFTQVDLVELWPSADRKDLCELRSKKMIEDTGVRRVQPPAKRRRIVWRFKPHQLPLPLED